MKFKTRDHEFTIHLKQSITNSYYLPNCSLQFILIHLILVYVSSECMLYACLFQTEELDYRQLYIHSSYSHRGVSFIYVFFQTFALLIMCCGRVIQHLPRSKKLRRNKYIQSINPTIIYSIL